jgi:hypothetical protein
LADEATAEQFYALTVSNRQITTSNSLIKKIMSDKNETKQNRSAEWENLNWKTSPNR